MRTNEDTTPEASRGRASAPSNGGGEPVDGTGMDVAPSAPGGELAELLQRLLGLEGELRTLRALLDVRNEAFRVLMARLVAVEMRKNVSECDRLARERDEAVALANALQDLKLFRYTKWPRAAYGALLRVTRSLRETATRG